MNLQYTLRGASFLHRSLKSKHGAHFGQCPHRYVEENQISFIKYLTVQHGGQMDRPTAHKGLYEERTS